MKQSRRSGYQSPYIVGFVLWGVFVLAAAGAGGYGLNAIGYNAGMVENMLIVGSIAFSLGTFILYGVDKFFALLNVGRIPEKVLWAAALLGGSLGALLGIFIFRHKVSKPSFMLVFALILLLQIGLIVFAFQMGSGRLL